MSQQQVMQIFKASLVIALLVLGGFADRESGYEISLLLLYALPIGLAVWFFGVWAGAAAGGAATLIWIWADAAAGHIHSEPWIVYLNAGCRLIFFLAVVLAVGYGVRNLRPAHARQRTFSQTLPVCADCGKVRGHDGYWWDVKGNSHENEQLLICAKLCPDCARKAYAAPGEPTTPVSH